MFMIGFFIILFHFHLNIEDVSQTYSIMIPLFNLPYSIFYPFNCKFTNILFVIIYLVCVCVCVCHSVMFYSATPWIVDCQAPLPMEFSRQQNWSGLPFPSSRDLFNPQSKPGFPSLQANSLLSELQGKPIYLVPKLDTQ